jgi:hypothetical protein
VISAISSTSSFTVNPIAAAAASGDHRSLGLEDHIALRAQLDNGDPASGLERAAAIEPLSEDD